MEVTSYRTAIALYLILFSLFTFPFWGMGKVISPYLQHTELASAVVPESDTIENRKFSDFGNVYIPEVAQHLSGKRSGWITLWTNQNEMGRPMFHTSGFSPAYFPSWFLSKLTNNPWYFITVLSLATCFFTGLFFIMYCKEIGLHPLAGLIAGSSLATSPHFMYWLTFPMFTSTVCWGAGALWGVTRLANKSDLLGWSILSFSLYSLLMTAYPQAVIFQAYILAIYGGYLAYHQYKNGWFTAGKFLALTMGAMLVGISCALPVYLDLAHIATESGRVSPDPSFFTTHLTRFRSLLDLIRFFVLGALPELFGNPINSTYPLPYNSLSITPLIVFASILSACVVYKKTWGWWLAVLIFCLLAFVPPLYLFGVHHFGFNLSRINPLGGMIVPFTVIIAYGIDALIIRSAPKISQAILIATISVFLILLIAIFYGISQDIPIFWHIVLINCTLIYFFATQFKKTQQLYLVLAVVIIMATQSFPLMFVHRLSDIATNSPLTDKIRTNLPTGSRFAITTPEISVLPSNLNAAIGLASIHTYNSLSSKRYHKLINELGGKMITYGRHNKSVSPDYSSTIFWMSNIGLILAADKISRNDLIYIGEEANLHLYKNNSRMGDGFQITNLQDDISNIHTFQPPDIPQQLSGFSVLKTADHGDKLEFRVNQGEQSILILSQKFHRDWQAQVLVQSQWIPAQTLEVNKVFQGVALPRNTQLVRLAFKPYVRYAWVGNLLWILLLSLFVLKIWQKRIN
jgi:hypothetical protein